MNWLSTLIGRRKPAPAELTAKSATVPGKVSASVLKSMAAALRASLAGVIPGGGWVSDHHEEANHNTGFNYICVHAIATQVMGAEVSVFLDTGDAATRMKRVSRRKALRQHWGALSRMKALYGLDDSSTEAMPIDHPLVKLLKNPNPYETGAMFRYRQAQQLRLTGTCFAWNVPSLTGVVCQRYVCPTSLVTPVPPTTDMPLGGWRIQPYDSRYAPIYDDGFVEGSPAWAYILGKTIDAREVQVIRLPHAWRLDDGWSPISAGGNWIDLEQAVDTARTAQLRNGVDPSIAIELPPDVVVEQDEMDSLCARLASKYGGSDNVGKVMVTLNGTKVTTLSQTAKDMCYSEGFQDTKAAVLALHQTPPVALGFQEPGAYAAYFASMLAWRNACIQPLCDMLAESDTKHIAPQFGEGLAVEIESPMVNDKDQEEKEFQNNVAAEICTIDELRAKRGFPPLPNGEGKQLAKKEPPQMGKPGIGNGGAADQNGGGNDGKDDDTDVMPQTPFMRKSMRAAWEAVEQADKEWIGARLKAFNPDEQRSGVSAIERSA